LNKELQVPNSLVPKKSKTFLSARALGPLSFLFFSVKKISSYRPNKQTKERKEEKNFN
jgi:hypothetical protein